MNLQQYTEKRVRYKKLAKRVANILEEEIEKYNNPDKKFSLLSITSREKCPKKLAAKIEKENEKREKDGESLVDKEHIEEEIKDLAGCRIIFYYNDDVKKFIASGIVLDLFDVEVDNAKVHYSSDSYRAIHYIIRLKGGESNEFDGLRCEIQIHTLLNHAYSETAHDITYKSIETKKYGAEAKKDIDDRLQRVMETLLIPAGYELQKIKNDYQTLLEGIGILDSDNIEKIKKANNTNEIYEILEKFQRAIKYYNNASALNLVFTILEQSIKKARSVPCGSIETPFGNFPGYNFAGIIALVLDTLRLVQYADTAKTFAFLVALYEEIEEENLKKQILDFSSNFSGYKYHIFQKYGFFVQKTLITEIENLDSKKRTRACDLICNICCSIFNFEIKDNDEITYLLPINNELRQLRQKAMTILFELWNSCEIKDKFSILKILESACQTPSNMRDDDNLLSIVLEDSLTLVEFYFQNQDNESYIVRETMYQRTICLNGCVKDIQGKEQYKNLWELNQKLLDAIEKLHREVKKDERFECYHLLLDHCKYPWLQTDSSKKLNELLDTITVANVYIYIDAILHCIEYNDINSRFFESFIESISEKFPKIFSDLVIKENKLNKYLGYILKGLYRAKPSYYYELIDSYIEKNSNLSEIILSLNLGYDEARFKKAYDKAYAINDINALYQSIIMVFNGLFSNPKSLFLDIIKKFTSLQYKDWIGLMPWHYESYKSLVAKMDGEDVENIVDNLKCIAPPNVDNYEHHIEHVLFPIANNFPEKVLSYFRQQISAGICLPFQFSEIKKAFLNNSALVFKTLESWYAEELNHYEICNLFRLIYPEFTLELQKLLKKYISKDSKNIPFVLGVLDSFRRQVSILFDCKEILYESYKKIVKVLPEKDSLLESIENSLLGDLEMYTGHDGRKKIFENAKNLMKYWSNDQDQKVKDFSANLLKKLNNIKIPSELYRMEEKGYVN